MIKTRIKKRTILPPNVLIGEMIPNFVQIGQHRLREHIGALVVSVVAALTTGAIKGTISLTRVL